MVTDKSRQRGRWNTLRETEGKMERPKDRVDGKEKRENEKGKGRNGKERREEGTKKGKTKGKERQGEWLKEKR